MVVFYITLNHLRLMTECNLYYGVLVGIMPGEGTQPSFRIPRLAQGPSEGVEWSRVVKGDADGCDSDLFRS